jgi:hypothetical protein
MAKRFAAGDTLYQIGKELGIDRLDAKYPQRSGRPGTVCRIGQLRLNCALKF